jgi:hypothetical protein
VLVVVVPPDELPIPKPAAAEANTITASRVAGIRTCLGPLRLAPARHSLR